MEMFLCIIVEGIQDIVFLSTLIMLSGVLINFLLKLYFSMALYIRVYWYSFQIVNPAYVILREMTKMKTILYFHFLNVLSVVILNFMLNYHVTMISIYQILWTMR